MVPQTLTGGGTLKGLHTRMLIIDDDVAVLDEMADCYARQGFQVETAVHAGDALIILSESRPDLVLLGISGLADVEVLRGLRTVDPVVPVILLTERSEPALAQATRGLGVLGAIAKSLVRLHASGLRRLVEENVEALELGLRVVDSRFAIGRSVVDLVALDAKGSLVLVAVGLTADARMYLRAVDVYGWCRENPDVLRKLFPAARISPEQPLRLLFAAQRFTRFFRRGVEELRFADVRCLQLLDLGASGVAAVPLGAAGRAWARGTAEEPGEPRGAESESSVALVESA